MAIVVIEVSELEQLIEAAVSRALQRAKPEFAIPHSANNKLLNIHEVANLLDVSISTVNSYKRLGLIPFHRLGRRIFFKEEEILESLKKIKC